MDWNKLDFEKLWLLRRVLSNTLYENRNKYGEINCKILREIYRDIDKAYSTHFDFD